MTKVSVVKCHSYNEEEVYNAVKKSLNLINGFEIKKTAKVLIKPNCLSPHKPEEAITTHPAVVDAICRILKEKGIKNITVGDSAGFTDIKATEKTFKVSGIAAIAKKYKAKLIPFEKPTPVKIKDPKGKVLKEIQLAKPVLEADFIINVPKLKTHLLTKYTGAVKNLFGCVPGGRKQIYHIIGINETKFSNLLLDIYQNIKPQLNIMDGILGLEGNGPGSAGIRKKSNVILASKNAIALDIVASKIIGFDPMDIYTNRFAIKRKLFPSLDSIIVMGEKDVFVKYKKPTTAIRKVPDFIAAIVRKFVISKPYVDEERCTKCGACFRVCPVKAIKMLPYPTFNRSKCILCYCCIENCPEGAITPKKPLTEKFIKFFRKLLRF